MKNYEDREIFSDLKKLFFDNSNRPKKTPLYESVIQRRLEDLYSASEIKYALKKLQDKKIVETKRLVCREKKIEQVGKIKFYFPASLEQNEKQKERIENKITKLSVKIRKYSSIQNITLLGKHLHYLVKSELRAQQFKILSENTNEFEGKKWQDSNHTLDLIAKHDKKDVRIGVEVKNSLDLMPKGELDIKLKMCKFFEIIPVFACRWIRPFFQTIQREGGFPWEFKKQIYPFGQEKMVQSLQKRLKLPVQVSGELPSHSVKNFKNWLDGY